MPSLSVASSLYPPVAEDDSISYSVRPSSGARVRRRRAAARRGNLASYFLE